MQGQVSTPRDTQLAGTSMCPTSPEQNPGGSVGGWPLLQRGAAPLVHPRTESWEDVDGKSRLGKSLFWRALMLLPLPE